MAFLACRKGNQPRFPRRGIDLKVPLVEIFSGYCQGPEKRGHSSIPGHTTCKTRWGEEYESDRRERIVGHKP